MGMRVAEIRIYPVKGLRGHAVPCATVEPWGLADDRRFMVVDAEGTFLTQRQLPPMAVLEADLVPGGVALAGPGLHRIVVGAPGPDASAVAATIWRDRVAARDCGAAVATWLTRALGRPCRLVHMADPATARPVDPEFAAPGDRVSFADGFPLLVTNAASLADLNARLAAPVGMDRFRTNVLVDGAAPWAEDGWQHLRIGETAYEGTKDCARCVVTTVDQDTGIKAEDNEPLRTLSRFRRKAKGRIVFGQNLVPRRLGRIAVGDVVDVPDRSAIPRPAP